VSPRRKVAKFAIRIKSGAPDANGEISRYVMPTLLKGRSAIKK
jgi:hypothetical protein